METIVALTQEDIDKIKLFVDKKNKGMMVDSKAVVELFNRVMYPKTARPTSCSGCLKGYIQTMERRLHQWEKMIELENTTSKATETPSEGEKTPEVINNIPEEKEVPVEAKNEEKVVEIQPKSKGRPRKEKK